MTKKNIFVVCSLLINVFISQMSQASDCQLITSVGLGIKTDYCLDVTVQSKNLATLAGVVVYLEPLSGQVLPASTATLVINQKNKAFSPYLSVVQSNQAIRFTNKDDITHHIYSVSADNKFSFKIRAGQSNEQTSFDHQSELAMGCNIHDWMNGYLLVLNTPYFAQTDQLGLARFSHVKPGKYQVVVWHPQMETKNNRYMQPIMVTDNSHLSVHLTTELSILPRQQNDDDFDFLSDY